MADAATPRSTDRDSRPSHVDADPAGGHRDRWLFSALVSFMMAPLFLLLGVLLRQVDWLSDVSATMFWIMALTGLVSLGGYGLPFGRSRAFPGE